MRHLLSLALIFVATSLFAQKQITVNISAQETSVNSQVFNVKCDFTKPKFMANYAVFSVKIPYGFNVKQKHSDVANFEYKDNIVKYTWIRLATTEKFNVAFELTPIKNEIKEAKISGSLMYIAQNKKGIINTDTVIIKILKTKEVKPETKVVKKEAEKTVVVEEQKKTAEIVNAANRKAFCTRKIEKTNNKGEYTITLILNNNSIDAFKIYESLPKGYTFKSKEMDNCSCSYKTGVAEFNLKNISNQSVIKVKYTLLNENAANRPAISGQLIYIKDNKVVRKIIMSK